MADLSNSSSEKELLEDLNAKDFNQPSNILARIKYLSSGSQEFSIDCDLSKINWANKFFKLLQEKISHFYSARSYNQPRVFCYYHYENSDLRIDAVGISNPLKVQQMLSAYQTLILASMRRLSKLLTKDDIVICFFDKKTAESVRNYWTGLQSDSKIIFVDPTSYYTKYTMWYRFKLLKHLNEFFYVLGLDLGQKFQLISMDTDYIPSEKLNCFISEGQACDVQFSTNSNSFPKWQINEGVYSLGTSLASVAYMDVVDEIYNALISDEFVRRYWREPRIWRGAQASMMLASYKFNETNDHNLKYKFFESGTCITVNRMDGYTINSPIESDFLKKNWDFANSKCYHFTGYQKKNALTREFLKYCLEH